MSFIFQAIHFCEITTVFVMHNMYGYINIHLRHIFNLPSSKLCIGKFHNSNEMKKMSQTFICLLYVYNTKQELNILVYHVLTLCILTMHTAVMHSLPLTNMIWDDQSVCI